MDCAEVLNKLAFDRISSSTQIAAKMIDCSLELFGRIEFKDAIKKIVANQPSMAVVLNIAGRILDAKTKEEIKSIKHEFEKAEELACAEASMYLEQFKNVATISFSESVLRTILMVRPDRVYLSLSHPAKEGERLAGDLLESKINVTLFEDSVYSVIMRNVDAVLIGADAVLSDGVINKVGSYCLALLAEELNKPFFVVASKFKVLDENARQLYKILSMKKEDISYLGCDVVNVYFEKVPIKLVDKIFLGG